jgi:hypothetical protein
MACAEVEFEKIPVDSIIYSDNTDRAEKLIGEVSRLFNDIVQINNHSLLPFDGIKRAVIPKVRKLYLIDQMFKNFPGKFIQKWF